MVDHDDFRSPLAPDANAGSVAIVTGGGTGIGRATAMELARTGVKVAICGRRPEPLEAVRQELDAAGSECLAMSADVREADQILVVEDGRIAEAGRHEELIERGGLYTELYRTQFASQTDAAVGEPV